MFLLKSRIGLVLSTLVWLITIVVGMGVLLNYETAPGVAAVPRSNWPVGSRVARDRERATLVMTVHPKCPCTRASISELARLMAQCQGKVSAKLLFLRPRGMPVGWEKTDLWWSAAAIPGVEVSSDYRGVEARRFGAKTSGQTFLFDAKGRLLFSGGITADRGHEGDNAGRGAIVAMLHGEKIAMSRTLVFGCSLVDPEAEKKDQ
jgi:hypothetical protein